MAKIGVVGSINMDLVVESNFFPGKGETILGKNFLMNPGGKGANQAVAASKLGADVSMFGTVGQDENGISLIHNFEKYNIDTSNIKIISNAPTGIAVIYLAGNDNSIIVVPGANEFTDIDYMKTIESSLLDFDCILIQMEIPMDAIEYIIDYLYKNKKKVILNPAPARRLPLDLIDKVTYLTPNEHEYQIIFDNEDMEYLLKKYPNKLMITCGENGVKYFNGIENKVIPSIRVNALDTTGAGDTYNGAFGVGISNNENIDKSMKFANIAAGISVTKIGAQSGMPDKNEVDRYSNISEE